jgi:hypothetical protein
LDTDGQFYEWFPHVLNVAASSRLRLENQPDEYARTLYLDRTRYPELIRLTEQLVTQMEDTSDPVAVSQALADYLANRGGFSYTLDFSNFDWDPRLDHIEDFLINKRRGHCEFFASALVLMLRSQGIPSRVVVGFHGGEFDTDANAYVIRKRHAHAWVEAYIRPDQYPEEWHENGMANGSGAWLRLDPTPATAEDYPRPTTPLIAAKDFWNTYVMGLNSAKQRQSALRSWIENPIRNVGLLFTARYWRNQWDTLMSGFWYRSSVFYLALVIALIVAFQFIRHGLRRNRRFVERESRYSRQTSLKQIIGKALALVAPRLGRWVAGVDKAAPEVAFFQRFLRMMQRQGQRRMAFQTAREFAQAAEQNFERHPQAAAIRLAMDSIVDKFYRIRFSERDLTADEWRQVESSLTFLEQNLTPNPALS